MVEHMPAIGSQLADFGAAIFTCSFALVALRLCLVSIVSASAVSIAQPPIETYLPRGYIELLFPKSSVISHVACRRKVPKDRNIIVVIVGILSKFSVVFAFVSVEGRETMRHANRSLPKAHIVNI